MNNLKKRFINFLVLCIPLRIYLIYLSKNIKKENKKYIIIFYLSIGIGMLILYFGSYRKTGIEVGGDVIWWNHLRPLHAFVYLYFSYLYYINDDNSYEILIYDVIIALISFFNYHYINNSFYKLIN